MVYVVGVPDPHVAIGTIAVAASAAANLSNHTATAVYMLVRSLSQMFMSAP
jgi:uncharacterized protein